MGIGLVSGKIAHPVAFGGTHGAEPMIEVLRSCYSATAGSPHERGRGMSKGLLVVLCRMCAPSLVRASCPRR
jgi:hypothetical protein